MVTSFMKLRFQPSPEKKLLVTIKLQRIKKLHLRDEIHMFQDETRTGLFRNYFTNTSPQKKLRQPVSSGGVISMYIWELIRE